MLLNFTTNSIKAIKRGGHRGPHPRTTNQRIQGGAKIEFADNGDGIAPEVEDTLFDPFVTTTAAKGAFVTDEEMAMGSGLGLAIVRDIVVAAGGTVAVGHAPAILCYLLVVNFPRARADRLERATLHLRG